MLFLALPVDELAAVLDVVVFLDLFFFSVAEVAILEVEATGYRSVREPSVERPRTMSVLSCQFKYKFKLSRMALLLKYRERYTASQIWPKKVTTHLIALIRV